MNIRPIRSSDIIERYGFSLPFSVRGFTAELDGEVLGVAGVMYSSPPQAFSHLDDRVKTDLRFVIRAIRELRELLNDQLVPIYAAPDVDENTANGFLRHVGFQQTEQEGVYVWPH